MGSPTDVVDCPRCHESNAANATRCSSCGALLSSSATVTDVELGPNWSRATRAGGPVISPDAMLEEGSVLAERYEILKLLGEGGMGAVYKARDRELDRLVALKVIRPELAGHASVLQRFKQELILARKITHRNVIRIYDLGVAHGLRFITMEFIEGKDLASLIEERQLYEPEEAVLILRQVCAALEAAHAEGVVHRDLKPQNIMIEGNGRVCVMDFGLARSLEATGMTQAGAVMGTPAYMSPEQAKGMPADERSDLFSVGIIAYQMLTGTVPFKADTALASMLARTQGPPPPPIELNPALPKMLSDIVLKALSIPIQNRYLSAALLDKDLHDWQQGVLHKDIVTPAMRMMEESHTKKWIGLAVAGVLVLMAGIYGVNSFLSRPAAPVAPMTVIIADFNNHTGDPVFTGTLESTLKLAMEGAAFISAYDRTKLRDLGLPSISGALDEPKAQGIAVSQGLNVVVSGSLDRRGVDYQLSLRASEAVTGKVIANADENASSKDEVLFAVTKAAATVRKALGDATSESAQRFAMETLSATSLEAVHEYAVALDALSRGKYEDSLKSFSQAVDLDPNFGLSYAGMASASHNLGREQEAEKYIREGLKHIDRMTERERYRTRAALYMLVGDQQKCVDEYGTLLAKYPSDTGAYNNMSLCSKKLRNLPKAVEEARRAVDILPKRAMYHVNLSIYSSYAGDFQTAAKEAAAVLQLNPTYQNGFVALAYSNIGQGRLTEAAAAYRDLEKVSPWISNLGLADLAVYEGRFSEAVAILQKAAAREQAARKPDAAAREFALLAYTQILQQKNALAIESAKKTIELTPEALDARFLAAQVFVAAGEAAKAQELAASLSSELQIEPQAYAKVIEGEAALKSGNGRQAVKLFTEANSLLDTWIGRFDLGRAYLQLGAFTEADSEFDRCLNRRGEALSIFLDDLPTSAYLPPLFYYQGLVREGLKSTGSVESYRKYLAIRGNTGEDPLLAEVRRRAGQ